MRTLGRFQLPPPLLLLLLLLQGQSAMRGFSLTATVQRLRQCSMVSRMRRAASASGSSLQRTRACDWSV
jgi:hypothetical protein